MATFSARRERRKKLICAVAIAEGEVRRKCGECSDRQREDFGCVSPTTHRQYITTTAVRGTEYTIDRCPYAVATHSGMRAVHASGLAEVGIMPSAGGWYDQTATFCRAMGIVFELKNRARDR